MNSEVPGLRAIITIQTAQSQYRLRFGKYAESVPQLVSAELLPPDLADGEKGGYRVGVRLTGTGYTVTADPLSAEPSRHFYYSDQSGTVRQDQGRPATARSKEIN